MDQDIQPLLERVHHQEYGQLLATLIGWLGDFELAEEALQDAFLAVLEYWPRQGVPQRPGAWLTTTARRKAVDRLRRNRADPVDLEQLDRRPDLKTDFAEAEEFPDDRLRLIFTCCHPSLPVESQVALTLHTLGGLNTAEIAAAFLTPVSTIAQRLVRAKRKIRLAGIPYSIPSPNRIGERIDSVLTVLYLKSTSNVIPAVHSSGDAVATSLQQVRQQSVVCRFVIRDENISTPVGDCVLE